MQNLLLIILFMYAIVLTAILQTIYFGYRKTFLYEYNSFKTFDYCNCVSVEHREYKDPSSTKFRLFHIPNHHKW